MPRPIKAPRRGALVCALALLVALAGCDRAREAAPGGATAPQVVEPITSVLRGFKAARYLPRDTVAMVAGDGAEALLERFGRARLLEHHRAIFERLSRDVEALVGYRMLEPAQLEAMGIDPRHPFGIGWLDLTRGTMFSVMRVSDEARLLEALRGLAREAGPLVIEPHGQGRVLHAARGDGGLSVVLRGGYAFMVLGDVPEHSHARRIAAQDEADALGSQPSFREAVAAIEAGGHSAAYVNVEAFAAATSRARQGHARALERDAGLMATAAAMVEAAGGQGAALTRARDLFALEADAWRREDALLSALLDGVDLATLGVDVDASGQALRTLLHLHLAEDATLGRLLRGERRVHRLPQRLERPPLLLFSGHVEPSEALRLAGLALAWLEVDLRELGALVARQLGGPLAEAVVPLLGDDVGLAISGDFEAMLSTLDLASVLDRLDLSLVIAVRDAAATRALFERLIEQPILGFLLRRADAPQPQGHARYTLTVPGWKQVHIQLAPATLALSTHDALLAPLIAAPDDQDAGFVQALPHPALRDLLGLSDADAVGLIDHRLTAGLMLLAARAADEPPLPRPVVGLHPPAYHEKWAALDALDRSLAALRQPRFQAAERDALAMLRPLGHGAMQVRAAPGRLEIEGGVFFQKEDLGAMIELLVKSTLAHQTGIDPRRLNPTAEDRRVRTLLRERRALRLDLERLLDAAAPPNDTAPDSREDRPPPHERDGHAPG